MSFYKNTCVSVITALLSVGSVARSVETFRIMPLGDSNTRGTYPINLSGPNPASIGAGGYRYPLQQMLAAGGYRYNFVGSQTSNAVGDSGLGLKPSSEWTYDLTFQRNHQGLAGFGNSGLLQGGSVPTMLGDAEDYAPPLVTCLSIYRPDIVLLMSGTNDLNLEQLDNVIRAITTSSPRTHLIVSTIFDRWTATGPDHNTQLYNAGIPALVTAAQQRGELVTFVDCRSALTRDDFCYNGLLGDGVHPNPVLAESKVAAVWYAGIQAIAPVPEPSAIVLCGIALFGLAGYWLRQRIKK
jgi:lysophospholipase L1-like esterase